LKKVSKKIVGITGAKGALGKYLVNRYKKKLKFKIYNNKIESNKNLVSWISKNKDIEIFLHFAAVVPVKQTSSSKKKTYLINSQSSINIIKKLNNANLKRLKYFLFSSSSHVYKPSFNKLSEKSKRIPATTYGRSKKRVEDFISRYKKNANFKIGIARIFNFYSSLHKEGFFIHDIKNKLEKNNKKLVLNKINTFRDYINMDQLCDILYFMINKEIDKPLNVGSGNSLNLIKLMNLIKYKFKYKTTLLYKRKKYPGLVANINLLRKIGYRKNIKKFNIK